METDGLISACILNGRGGAREVVWPEIDAWKPEDGVLWVHLNRDAEETRRWIEDKSGLGELVAEALMADETRPRAVPMKDGLLVIVRGVTHIPGPEPDELVSIRMWMDGSRIITVRRWQLTATSDIRKALTAGHGPRTTAEFLVAISDGMTGSVAPAIDGLEDISDVLEDQMTAGNPNEIRNQLADIRRQAIQMRRHMGPQREALSHLVTERVAWLNELERAQLREVREQTTRYIEDLDVIRDRCSVSQDQLASRDAQELNRTMYMLAVVTALFLPLTFITGLLGMNLGGLPGQNYSFGFLIWCVILAVVAILEIVIFRKLKLIR
jgi:zinc transporter